MFKKIFEAVSLFNLTRCRFNKKYFYYKFHVIPFATFVFMKTKKKFIDFLSSFFYRLKT